MRITYFYRKRQPDYFSIEQLFKSIQEYVGNHFDVNNHFLQHSSTGLIPRVKACYEAYRNQGDINHITGDVHYISFFLNKHKTILTVHDLEFIDRAKGFKKTFLKLFWLTIPAKRVEYITVISKATRERLLEICRIKPEKVVIIPNGINLKHLQYSPGDKILTKPVLLQVGTRHNKNLNNLFAAIKDIDCQILLVGELEQKYHKQLLNQGTDYKNYVNIPFEQVLELYRSCDILTFTSTYEGFGLPIIEAQAIGRPIVTSNISSMPEVAGKGACLVDPFSVDSIRDGINKIINDNVYREYLVSEGLQNVKRYEIETVAREYLDLYNVVLKR